MLAITGYVALRQRAHLPRLVGTGLAWLAAFLVHSRLSYGAWLPGYYEAGRLSLEGLPTHLLGHLVSPSRGLLVSSPIVAVVLYWSARHWRRLAARPLAATALVASGAHLVAVSAFPDWVGGHSYGPRLMTDVIPWLFLLSVLSLAALRTRPQRASLGVALVLAGWGVFVHARGAIAPATWEWNAARSATDNLGARVWDWSDPQFLAGLRPAPARGAPDVAAYPAYAPGARIAAGDRAAAAYFSEGWAEAGPSGRWSTAREALLAFALPPRARMRPAALRLLLAPYLVEGRLGRQRVELSLNGEALATLALDDREPRLAVLAVPAGRLGARNVILLRFPDARSPEQLRQGRKRGPRAIRLEWWELAPTPQNGQ